MECSKDNNGLAARREDLRQIAQALDAANALLRGLGSARFNPEFKAKGDPVTAADHAVNELLLRLLRKEDEGWLSEESRDDLSRTKKRRVWVVDPLDGTKEFIAGLPEWCVSIGLIEDGKAVAGGVSNPTTGEMFFGAIETGLITKGTPVVSDARRSKEAARVLASRTEVSRGKWDHWRHPSLQLCPIGSIAYRLALVAAGRAIATWTLDPRHEWDVAGGAALVMAAGGAISTVGGAALAFNQAEPRFEGLLALSSAAPDLAGILPTELVRPSHINR
jgi:myo-inositol-1(or 4)-monophosphatase